MIALGLSVLAVAIAMAAGAGRRPQEESLPQGERLEMLAERHAQAIKRLESAVRQLAGSDKRLYDLLQGAVRNVGVVRFDAFEDMGGRLSFSAALLDGNGDGVVVTSINGRQDTRCYAKQIRGGTSLHNLSDEEEQAIREALSGGREPVDAR
ncbi:MAG TPA: DUF4446 family protein [Actinomycetota bacterium]